RYPQGLTQYQQAKLRIYQQAKCCVVNYNDPLTYPDHKILSTLPQLISFGLQQGDYSFDAQQQMLCVHQQPLLAVDKMALQGTHNYLNCLTVLAMADAIGIARSATFAALTRFSGLPHRFQLVHQQNGVCWIDDSKATNVGSTIAALQSAQIKKGLHLLLGGDGKAADFTPLAPYVAADNVYIYCFGQDRLKLAALKPHASVVTETMAEAINHIKQRLQQDDIVLLSPACASLDQFRNYAERGLQFATLAKDAENEMAI